jgi:tetratricopeptide (TPR) repeat protein
MRKLSALVCLALLALLGCQKSWSEQKVGTGRAERPSHPKPEVEQARPEPEPKILPETYLAAGRLAETRGDLALAVAVYRKAIALNHDCVEGYNCLGLALDALGEYKQGEEAFLKAIVLAPDKAYLRNNLAFSYMRQGRWKDAESMLRKALELQPDFARARINLAMVFAQGGQYDRAQEEFLRVLPPVSAHYNMGLIYEAAQQYEQARSSYARALAANPRMESAQLGLKRLGAALGDSARGPQTPTGTAQANCKASLDSLTDAEPASAVLADPLSSKSEGNQNRKNCTTRSTPPAPPEPTEQVGPPYREVPPSGSVDAGGPPPLIRPDRAE